MLNLFLIPFSFLSFISEDLSMIELPTVLELSFGGNAFDYGVHFFMDVSNRLPIRETLLGSSGIYC